VLTANRASPALLDNRIRESKCNRGKVDRGVPNEVYGEEGVVVCRCECRVRRKWSKTVVWFVNPRVVPNAHRQDYETLNL
jgi:hypothetical protein